ncbi:hypothetical protein F383_20814 [Gossypium arboreum]|uniref:Uncharacterized protein n=1 Tax=Gossypium arboreum TaxID=29729 RepID=A0A0B0MMJ0_GOSAR|nr:hypothetical protein F383_20814 [Gossypium arboreum]
MQPKHYTKLSQITWLYLIPQHVPKSLIQVTITIIFITSLYMSYLHISKSSKFRT